MAVGCRSARAPGVGASASRLSRFFAIGAVRRLRCVFCPCSALQCLQLVRIEKYGRKERSRRRGKYYGKRWIRALYGNITQNSSLPTDCCKVDLEVLALFKAPWSLESRLVS